MATTWKSKIPATIAKTHKELVALIKTAALRVEAGAKLRAPVRTGFLRNSIQTVFDSDLTAVVFVGAEYGIYIELGARNRPPRPFLLPALEEVTREIGGEIVTR